VVRDFSIYTSYSHQSYDVSPGEKRTGQLGQLGSRWKNKDRRLTTDASLFLEKSYGGHAFGGTASADHEIFLGWHAGATFALAKYDKVTGSNDYALHSGLRLSHVWKSGLELGLASEYNSNVDQPKDFRAGAFARYQAL
jgi:hypothetical protein